jgi:hypothetical protein
MASQMKAWRGVMGSPVHRPGVQIGWMEIAPLGSNRWFGYSGTRCSYSEREFL